MSTHVGHVAESQILRTAKMHKKCKDVNMQIVPKKAQNALNARMQKFQTTQNAKKHKMPNWTKLKKCIKCQNKQNTEHPQL